MSRAEPRVCVGVVTGARGLRGELRIKTLTTTPEAVAAYGPVETEDGARRLRFTRVTLLGEGVVAAAADGIASRDAAESLKGARLYVPRDALPEPAQDELYAADLEGCEVRGDDGARLGEIAAVADFGAGALLEIRLDGRPDTVFLPFAAAYVPEVDLERRVVTVTPPGGWADTADA